MKISIRYILSVILVIFLGLNSTHAIAAHFRGAGFTWTMFDDDGDGQKNDLIVTYTSACASGNELCADFTNPSTLTAPVTTNPVNKDIDGYRLRVDQRLLKIFPCQTNTHLSQIVVLEFQRCKIIVKVIG